MADALKSAASTTSNTISSGAQQAQQAATNPSSSAATTAQDKDNSPAANTESEGSQKWNAMTEDQKKAVFDNLPEEKKQGKTYYEWLKEGYQNQKENWMPWIEDLYLKWFTNDNKASYATKDTLSKSKVTGIEQVDTVQDGVNNLVGSQIGQGGVLQPVGDAVSKEGVNRAERGGKDDQGSYGAAVMSGASSVGSTVWTGAKSAGGYVGGMVSGQKGESKTDS